MRRVRRTWYWGKRSFTLSYYFNNSGRKRNAKNTDFHKHLQASNPENSLVQNSSCNVTRHNTGHTSQQLLPARVSKNNRLVNKKACDHTKRETMETQRPAELKDPASSIRRSSAKPAAFRVSVSQRAGIVGRGCFLNECERHAHYERS